MNEIAENDQILLTQVKRQVEALAGLPKGRELSQKDYDFLSFFIHDKTGQALSLTTIKRIWKNDFQRLPHLSTLNMLTQLAFGVDWHMLKKNNVINTPQPAVSEQLRPENSETRHWPAKRTIAVLAAFGFVIVSLLAWFSFDRPIDTSTIKFAAKVTTDLSIPNSVVFSYDLNGVEAEPFFIQQSWDPMKKVEISKDQKKQTDIYYEPGYHYAKLTGNGKVLKEIPVHIKYNNWYVRFRLPDSELIRVPSAGMAPNRSLSLDNNYAQSVAEKIGDKFQLGYMLSKEFDFEADNFQLSALLRFDSIKVPSCPIINVLIKGEQDYVWVTIGNKGCESNLGLKVGNTKVDGKKNDLSLLGINAFEWQHLAITIHEGSFILRINDREVHRLRYTNRLGTLKELDFFFNGIGALDNVNMGNSQEHTQISLGY